jgi:hypothetical protein
MHDSGRAKGGQGGFVKATQDEFLFAGVGVDVAHSKDAGHIGGKCFGVDHQLLAFHGQAPVGDGAEFGGEA